MKFSQLIAVLWLAAALPACGARDRSAQPGHADSSALASQPGSTPAADPVPATPVWIPKPILIPADPKPAHPDSALLAAADSQPADSAADPAAADPAAPSRRTRRKLTAGERRRYQLSPADSARWPVKGPAPLPGALLPEHRIVAFYGNPKSSRMGILGQLPPEEMLPKLERTATEWAKADPGRPVMPALHLIATVAQGKPGAGQKYRLRHSDQLIERVLGWAEERGWLVFLDVQIGHSTVPDELPHLVKYLELPYVHLALDPEFAMKLGGIPGKRIGTLDATDVNYAVRLLADIVDRKKVPPKVLVVHRFTQRMLTNHDKITLDPRVQVVVDMDGFGAPWLKEDAYKFFIVPEPVEFTGFKLFFKNDKPMMTPEQVIRLWPVPYYIQYQ
ncbi:MAG TPA: hypothetical protein VJQ46_01560 [Gemmatimonadales bacterium]|nr:hypothetical protein [Gemmatimonadales bacterium]